MIQFSVLIIVQLWCERVHTIYNYYTVHLKCSALQKHILSWKSHSGREN